MNCWFLQNKRTISIEIDHKGGLGFCKEEDKGQDEEGGDDVKARRKRTKVRMNKWG
jgi:hypothetical protein